MDKRLLIVLISCTALLSAGCVCQALSGGEGGGMGSGGAGGGADGGAGGSGGDVIIVEQHNSTGMSDPSKCNNLPPQQMADCLEQSMGG